MTMTRLSGASMSDQASFSPLGRNVLNTNNVETCDPADAANRACGLCG